jgi:hypothetical protein
MIATRLVGTALAVFLVLAAGAHAAPTQPTAIAGPITANLFIASSPPDTELFVQLIDRAPDGSPLSSTAACCARAIARSSARSPGSRPTGASTAGGASTPSARS